MRILMIVEPGRRDFYSYLEQDQENEYVLLWYESVQKFKSSVKEIPSFFKEIFFWNEYLSPWALLRDIKPDRIVFFEITDLRQIALLVAANTKGVLTIYLEHGAAGDRETAIKRFEEEKLVKNIKPYLAKRLLKEMRNVVLAKIFYYSVVRKFYSFSSWWKYFLLPFRMLRQLPHKVLNSSLFKERAPKIAIVFSEANQEEFELYTDIRAVKLIKTGVPFFDRFYRESKNLVSDHIVYIDSPFYEEGLLDWTKEHHAFIAETLFNFAEKNGIHVYVKLHPRSSMLLWESYKFNNPNFTIIQEGDFTDLLLDASLILGYSSSMITGLLCAQKNIVILSWHPKSIIFGADFSKTGLCHLSASPVDIDKLYTYWANNNFSVDKKDEYLNFLKRFNYPFDGRATNRVIEIISKTNSNG